MNKVYKLVWSQTTNSWIVASELAKGKKKSSKVAGVVSVATLVLSMDQVAYAAFTGDGGSATGLNSIAIGSGTNAAGENAIAIGKNAFTDSLTGMAIGLNAKALAGGASAIGQSANASGVNSFAIGKDSVASALNAISYGVGAKASGENSAAFGYTASASNSNATALGYQANASNSFATALGGQAIASGISSTAVGPGAQAAGDRSVALGRKATAIGNESISVGNSANASADNAQAIGMSAIASGVSSIAQGLNTQATSANTMAIGTSALASGASSIAQGLNAQATSENAVSIGVNTIAKGNNAFAAGTGASAVTNGTAVGYGAIAANNATAMGLGSNAAGQSSIAIGHDTKASGNSSSALGYQANASNTNAVALGYQANALNSFATALGGQSVASGLSSTAVGPGAQAIGDRSVALGRRANATGNESISVGNSANASADNAQAIGMSAIASGVSSIAQGANAIASAVNTVAIGNGATSSLVNSVALGSGSTTTAPTGTGFITGTAVPTSVVSVGTTSNLRRIQNVADGSAMQDAVTVAQLLKAQENIGNIIGPSATLDNGNLTTTNIGGTGKNTIDAALKVVKTEVAKGQNTTVTSTTGTNGQTIYTVNADSSSVSGSTGVSVIAETQDADGNTNYVVDLSTATKEQIKSGTDAANTVSTQGLTFKAGDNTSTDAKKLGDTVTITGDSNITTTADANGIKVALSKDLTLTDGSINFGGTGPVITKGGINMGGTTITNVGKGTALTDAATVGQLTKVEAGTNTTVTTATGSNGETIYTVSAVQGGQSVQNTVSAGTSGLVTVKTSSKGGATDYEVDLTADVKEQIKSGADAANTVSTQGLTFKAGDNTSTNAKKLGDTVTIMGAATNTDFSQSDAGKNIYTQVDDKGNIIVGLAKDLVDLTSITVKNGTDGKDGTTVIGQDGISVTGPKGPNGEPGKTTTITGGMIETETIRLTGKDGKDGVDLTLDFVDGFVEYERNKDGSINKDKIILAGTPSTSTKNADGTITTIGGTVISNVASAGDYKDVANASKAVNAGDLNNAVASATTELANKGLHFGANSGDLYKAKLGDTISIMGAATNTDFSQSDAGKNIYTQVDDNGNIVVGLAKNLTLIDGSINFGGTAINNTGLTIFNGPSITVSGINAAGNKITNVAKGIDDNDAVNVSQLKALEDNFKNYTGGITSGVGNIAVSGNSGVEYKSTTDVKVVIKGDDANTTFANSDEGKNIYTQVDATGSVTIGLAKNVDLTADGSLDVGTTKVVDGEITGLTNKDLSASDFGEVGRSATEEQLGLVKADVDKNTTNIQNLTTQINNLDIGKGLVQQADPTAEITVAKDTGGTVVNIQGKDGVDRTISGVSEGVKGNDAVNVSQLNKVLGGELDSVTNTYIAPNYNVAGNTYNNVGGAIDALDKADQATNTRIDNLTNNIEQAFYNTNSRINDVEKRANAGIAAAMALESAPYVPGKFTYAAGAAYHGGENAIGVTLRRTADNGRWSLTGGIAKASEGDASFRIGISGVID